VVVGLVIAFIISLLHRIEFPGETNGKNPYKLRLAAREVGEQIE
jgi:hypothetical protein